MVRQKKNLSVQFTLDYSYPEMLLNDTELNGVCFAGGEDRQIDEMTGDKVNKE